MYNDITFAQEPDVKIAIKTYENVNRKHGAGTIIDADTILTDIIKNADVTINNIGSELLKLWIESSDIERKCMEKMFYHMFDIEFSEYVSQCIINSSFQ